MKSWMLIICFSLLNLSQTSIAQNVSIFGLELGISFSQFPTKSEWDEIAKSGTIEINPLISPLIGISKEWIIFKHLQITFGAQYQMSGDREYKFTKYTWPVINDYYENWESIKIHKLSIPITLGYTFKINKIKPSIYFGARPNYILSVNQYSKHHVHNEPDRPPTTPQDTYSEQKLNLYKYTFVSITPYVHYNPPKRLLNQLCLGVSTSIGQNIKINLSYNLGHYSYTWDYDYGYGAFTETIVLPGSDYILSLQYNFTRPVRNK